MKAKYYNSIDTCPIILFVKIQEGKKTKLDLCFEGKATEKEAIQAWDELYKEYVEEFGISAEYAYYLRQKALLCEYYANLIVEGQNWFKTIILVKEAEIKILESKFDSSLDLNEILGKLAKKMGFAINISKTTIREFYSYVKS